MKIAFAKTVYQFSIFSILLYLFLVTLLISLGVWQLSRADEKKLFLASQKISRSKPAIKLTSILDKRVENIRFRKTKISGTYDQQHQFLVDNQIVNGQAGYFVLTPFKLEGMNQAVLINRGWVILNKDRRVLPDISFSTTAQTTLNGRINHFPSVGIRLAGAEIPTEGWPSVVQVVDSSVLSEKLDYPLFPFQIELDADMDDGYYREWKKRTIMSPEKHVGYAVQWFGLAITLTVLFIWVSRVKVK